MNTKAQLSPVQIAIISLIVLVLLMVLTTKIASQYSSSGKIGTCQASVLKATIFKEGSKGIIESSLECNDLPDIQLKKSTVFSNNRINDDLVKTKIADSMLQCWKMVGQGSIDPFKKYDDDQAYCMVCSDILFNDDFISQATEQQYELVDVNYWLATHTIPGYKATYFEALYGQAPDSAAILEFRNKEFPFDITQQYAIVWRMNKVKPGAGALAIIGTSTLGGAALGAKSGAFIGSFVGPVGTAVGGTLGGVGGAAIGLFGSYYVSDSIHEEYPLSTSIWVVPKSKLGEDITFSKNGIEYKEPFCTKLVNY